MFLAFVAAACALILAAGWALWRGRATLGPGLLFAAAALFVLGALTGAWGHATLYRCYDDGALYNCTVLAGNDSISLAEVVLIGAAVSSAVIAFSLRRRKVGCFAGSRGPDMAIRADPAPPSSLSPEV